MSHCVCESLSVLKMQLYFGKCIHGMFKSIFSFTNTLLALSCACFVHFLFPSFQMLALSLSSLTLLFQFNRSFLTFTHLYVYSFSWLCHFGLCVSLLGLLFLFDFELLLCWTFAGFCFLLCLRIVTVCTKLITIIITTTTTVKGCTNI